MTDDLMDFSPALRVVLEMTRASPYKIGHAISKEMADELIWAMHIKMAQAPHNLSNEKSGLFQYKDTLLRLELDYFGNYTLYNGPWQPDQHRRNE